MKKTIVILIIALLVLALAVGAAAMLFLTSPQYAMIQILKDVNAGGMDGLKPHLTGDAAALMEKVTTITENPLLSKVMGLFVKSEYLDVLKSELQNVTWNVEDVMKSSKRAQVMLSFNYQDEITGTINVSMIRTEDGWKIDGVNSPKIDGFNFDDIDFSAFEKIVSGETEASESEGFSIGGISIPDFENFNFKDIELPNVGEFSFEDIQLPDVGEFSFEDIQLPDFGNLFGKNAS